MKQAKNKNFNLPTTAASRHTTPLRGYFLSSRFICEATNQRSSRFYYEATGCRVSSLKKLVSLRRSLSAKALLCANSVVLGVSVVELLRKRSPQRHRDRTENHRDEFSDRLRSRLT